MRKWLPLIAVAFLLFLGAGVWYARSHRAAPAATEPAAVSPEALHANWKTRVTEILAAYDRDGNAQTALNALSELRVSAADKEIHLSLVLAFASIVEGDKKGAERLARARAAF